MPIAEIAALFSVGSVAIFIVVWDSCHGPYGSKNITHKDQRADQAGHDCRGPPEDMLKAKRPALEADVTQIGTDEKHHRREEAYWERQIKTGRRLNHITLIGAVVGLGGLVGIMFSFLAAKEAATQAKRQADIAFAQLRPWVTVTPTLDGDIVIGEGNTSFNIGFDLKNVGHSPAFDVQLIYEVRPYGFAKPPPAKEPIFCAVGKRLGGWKPGHWIPPGSVYPIHRTTMLVSNSLILDEVRGDDLPSFWALIIGCALYRIDGDSQIHETPFMIELYRWNADRPAAMTSFRYVPQTIIDQASLRVREITISKGEPY